MSHIAPCDKCGGAGGLESLTLAIPTPCDQSRAEYRHRVKCAKCHNMTPTFCDARLAVTLWNSWATEHGDKLRE